MKAAANGKLDCLENLIAKGANVNDTDKVSVALPAAPSPLQPSPSALAARRPCCPALAAAAHRVWCRRRASAERHHGPPICDYPRQAQLPRAPRRQGRQRECRRWGEHRPASRHHPPAPSPSALAARRPCYPALTAAADRVCGAAAAPPQNGGTALIWAAMRGKLDCLEHLITKGANLEATNKVSAAPSAAP